MSLGNVFFLCIAVGAITLFGGVLAWASWMEARDEKRKASRSTSQTYLDETSIREEPITGAHAVNRAAGQST
jgi:hypothetical protein